MKQTIIFFTATLLIVAAAFTSCNSNNQGHAPASVDGSTFGQLIEADPEAVILDVRTSGEFEGGHLANARNIDWNGNSFDEQVKGFDKNAQVFVYCLSGGRSASAAAHLRSEGFKNVTELKGGLMAWHEAKLTNESGNVEKTGGMTTEAFAAQIKTGKVLVDFNAVWCAPCKRMAPFIKEIEEDMKASLKVMSIDADENNALAIAQKVDALPTLFLYQDGKLVWTHVGYISKEELLAEINRTR